MAADLHIHIFEGITEQDLAEWNSHSQNKALYERVAATPNEWVGEVSWLKAALFEDLGTFVPSAVQKISDLIGEDLPVIDEAFISKVAEAMTSENKTGYSLASAETVLAFLRQHLGKRVFTVSW